MNPVPSAFVLSVILLLCVTPIESYPNTVRTVYFSPTDVPNPTDEVLSEIRTVMVDVQQFYRDEMERHEYDPKTFNLETDDTSRVVIHAVNGKHDVQKYTDTYLIEQELPPILQDTFKIENNIRVIFLGGAEKIGSGAFTFTSCRGDICGHTVYIPAANAALIRAYTAHEIGHAFGLNHNSRGSQFVMKTMLIFIEGQIQSLDEYNLDDYEARWIDKHRFFNNQHSVNLVPRIVKVHRLVPLEIERRDTILFMIDIRGDNELHQLQVSRMHDGVIVGWDKICDTADSAKIHVRRPSLLGSDKVRVQIIDVLGNIKGHVMPIVLPSAIPTPVTQVGKTEDKGKHSVMWATVKIR